MKKISLILLSITILFSCKKGLQDKQAQTTAELTTKFFNIPANAKPEAVRIWKDLKKQNEISNYVKQIIDRGCFPGWDKAIIHVRNTNALARDSAGNVNDTIVQIPMLNESGTQVDGFLQAKLNGEIFGNSYFAEDYKEYFPSSSNNYIDYEKANEYATLFMKMQVVVLGTKAFKIKDTKLFTDIDNVTNITKHLTSIGLRITTSKGVQEPKSFLTVTLDNGCEELWYNDTPNADPRRRRVVSI